MQYVNEVSDAIRRHLRRQGQEQDAAILGADSRWRVYLRYHDSEEAAAKKGGKATVRHFVTAKLEWSTKADTEPVTVNLAAAAVTDFGTGGNNPRCDGRQTALDKLVETVTDTPEKLRAPTEAGVRLLGMLKNQAPLRKAVAGPVREAARRLRRGRRQVRAYAEAKETA